MWMEREELKLLAERPGLSEEERQRLRQVHYAKFAASLRHGHP